MGLFDKMNKPVFLKEESDAAEFIVKLKDLQTRATGKVKERIEKEIKLATIGEIGENNIAFELKNCGMPIYIMHDIHFEIDGLSAQIDFIVVTRKITFIIECKNLIGNIDIDSEGNFIRNYELFGKHVKEGIYSPITQNQRHFEILKQIKRESKNNVLTKILFDKYFDSFYRSIVVLANPKTMLNAKYAKKDVKEKVIRADQLNKYIKGIYEESKQPASSDKEMKAIAEGLLALHTPNKSDYAKKYEDIIDNMKVEIETKPIIDKKTYIKPSVIKEEIIEIKPIVTNEKLVEAKSLVSDEELIKSLKAFRLEKSREEKIKPYFIFNDNQMMELISKRPKSKEDIINIYGFGPAKVEKYGEIILKILASS